MLASVSRECDECGHRFHPPVALGSYITRCDVCRLGSDHGERVDA